ncbi:hypothetical protein ACFL4Q_05295 [candidate division KSB1 bacterium]
MKVYREFIGKKILEIGNVLRHYFPCDHTVIDKFEKAPGVRNIDIIDLNTSEKYDLIVSISTLEHVGYDEDQKNHNKISRAIDILKKCKSDTGTLIITLPLGYNADLDSMIKNNELNIHNLFFLKRISRNNIWVETVYKDIENCKYGTPFPYANGLVVGIE